MVDRFYFDVPERKNYFDFTRPFLEIDNKTFVVKELIDEELNIQDVSLLELIKDCNNIIKKYPKYKRIVLEFSQGYSGDFDDYNLVGFRQMTKQEKNKYLIILKSYNNLEKEEILKDKKQQLKQLKRELKRLKWNQRED